MYWIIGILIYCIACVLAVLYIRRRNKMKDPPPKDFDLVNWIVLTFVAPLGIVLSPFWLPFILVPHYRDSKEYKRRKKEMKRWRKVFKARAIIGGKEVTEDELQSVSIYKCKKCGYIVRTERQGFFKLTSGVYYNFYCKNCKNIVSIHSGDIVKMGYLPRCPQCDETAHNLSFWNPIEGHCPKCNGMMVVTQSLSR